MGEASSGDHYPGAERDVSDIFRCGAALAGPDDVCLHALACVRRDRPECSQNDFRQGTPARAGCSPSSPRMMVWKPSPAAPTRGRGPNRGAAWGVFWHSPQADCAAGPSSPSGTENVLPKAGWSRRTSTIDDKTASQLKPDSLPFSFGGTRRSFDFGRRKRTPPHAFSPAVRRRGAHFDRGLLFKPATGRSSALESKTERRLSWARLRVMGQRAIFAGQPAGDADGQRGNHDFCRGPGIDHSGTPERTRVGLNLQQKRPPKIFHG